MTPPVFNYEDDTQKHESNDDADEDKEEIFPSANNDAISTMYH